MRSHSAKFKRIEFVGAYLTCLRIAILGFFLVGAKIRLLHEVGQALLWKSFQALNLAAFYYHFRGGWWRESVSASQRIRGVNGTSPLCGAFGRLYFFWDIGLGDLSVRLLLSCI